MDQWKPDYAELKSIYSDYFSLKYACSLEDKFALIGLICYITNKLRIKNPDITCWEVIAKIAFKEGTFTDEYVQSLRGLSIMCEDFMYGVTKFPTFGFKTDKEILNKIKEVLDNWLPF